MLGTKLKVLVLNTSSKQSGAEKSLIDVLKVLQPSCDLVVVLPSKEGLYYVLEKEFNLEIINLLRFTKNGSFFVRIKEVLSIVKSVSELLVLMKKHQIDVIYSNTLSAQVYGSLLRLFTGKKLVWHVRDNLFNKYVAFALGFLADKIIAISDHILKQIPFKTKVELVYNGIDAKSWKSNPSFLNIIKQELDIDLGTILVAHVGQILPQKRHDLFIDVAKHLINHNRSKVHFVIIGSDLFGDFRFYQKDLKQKVLVANLSHRISFLEYRDNFKECLNGIDILVHLSDSEPFGRVIIEAMALEKPVVAQDQGGPKEIIKDEISGYLVKEVNPSVIANRLRILINDPSLRSRLGKEGRKIVENKFSLSSLEKINTILANHR